MNTYLNVNQLYSNQYSSRGGFRNGAIESNGSTYFTGDDYQQSGSLGRWSMPMWNVPAQSFCCCQANQMMMGSPGFQMQMMQNIMQMVTMGGMDPGAALLLMNLLSGSQSQVPMQGLYPQYPPMFTAPQPPPPQPRHSGLAEPYKPNATVAVFDDFHDTANNTTHGEVVEDIMLQHGLRTGDIQRFHSGERGVSVRGMRDAQNPEQFSCALDGYIEASFAHTLSATSENMEQILDDPNSKIKVIQQSQGKTPADVVHNLMSIAGQDPQFRERLKMELGLPADCSNRQFVQALSNRILDVQQNSPLVQAEQQRYEELSAEADARGINHVIAANNNGGDQRALERLGVDVPPEFFVSVLNNEHTTSVGALNKEGTGAASFSAPQAEIAAPGEEVVSYADGKREAHSGTSLAAPAVAAEMARLRQMNPHLTDEQAEQLLLDTATRVPGSPAQLGAGAMNARLAMWNARPY